jgi:N4-(beta-N-acetylglucosaminyl)-L-asparaginase
MQRLRDGAAPVDAVVDGVSLVEDDPDDMTVGYGGLPNEDGVVQLDASVMDGPSHKSGAVAALERIRNPARVALKVMRETDHVLIVGDGALRFAKAHGFQEQDLLTEKARQVWLKWKRNLNPDDDWLDDDQHLDIDAKQAAAEALGIPWSYGTIHCGAVDERGDVGACTTTSGLSYKIPGRVGDSPIVGAGMFVDNAVGAAGATGRGEAVIQSCGAFQIVQRMQRGLTPTEACLDVLKWIAGHTHRRMLLNERGEPNFGVTFYAVRKDGLYGSAAMRTGENGPPRFTVHDGTGARHEDCAVLYGSD